MTPTDRYLDLLKRALVNRIYFKHEPVVDHPNWVVPGPSPRWYLRLNGQDCPSFAHTMIGLKRLDFLQECMEDVVKQDVKGDFMECGVWRGGAAILMRGFLECDWNELARRRVWVADSFQGLPAPDIEEFPADAGSPLHEIDILKVSLREVTENFNSYGLLGSGVQFLPGWFKDTLPPPGLERLAILRIDCDMYESTSQVLEELYPLMESGGYVIVDDYKVIPACAAAVEDYRKTQESTRLYMDVDGPQAWWRKP